MASGTGYINQANTSARVVMNIVVPMRTASPTVVNVGTAVYNTYFRNSVNTTTTLSGFGGFFSNKYSTGYSASIAISNTVAQGQGVTVLSFAGNGNALDDEL